MSNRVEHQKLNQVTAELPPGWVFGVQLGLRQTEALIKTTRVATVKLIIVKKLLSAGKNENNVHSFLRHMEHFLTDMSNRVEQQKRNQPAIKKWLVGVFLVFISAICVERENRVEQKKLNQEGSLVSYCPPGWV